MFKRFMHFCILGLVFALIVVISKNKNYVDEKIDLNSEDINLDFSNIAIKYKNYINISADYTLSIELDSVVSHKRDITNEELEQLVAYQGFLNSFNGYY